MNLSKLLTDIEISDIDVRDYPDFSDAYISSAKYSDTLKPLSERDLDALNENHPDFVFDLIMEELYG